MNQNTSTSDSISAINIAQDLSTVNSTQPNPQTNTSKLTLEPLPASQKNMCNPSVVHRLK